jgi:hypothetical protein
MIKKLLFITAIFFVGTVFSQTSIKFMDHNDIDIGGTLHTEFGDGTTLANTKFHIQNISANSLTYTCEVTELSNPLGADLQVCYGTNCFTADAGVPTPQNNAGNNTISVGAIDSTFKVAPFTFIWSPGDSSIWRIKVYNTQDVNDFVTVDVTYKWNTVSIKEISSEDVNLSIYPNPASTNLTIDYSINSDSKNAKIDVYDVVGQKVMTHALINNNDKLNINLNSLTSGVYFYTIKVDDKTLRTERVIVK